MGQQHAYNIIISSFILVPKLKSGAGGGSFKNNSCVDNSSIKLPISNSMRLLSLHWRHILTIRIIIIAVRRSRSWTGQYRVSNRNKFTVYPASIFASFKLWSGGWWLVADSWWWLMSGVWWLVTDEWWLVADS